MIAQACVRLPLSLIFLFSLIMDGGLAWCLCWLGCGIFGHLANITREQMKLRKLLEKPIFVRMVDRDDSEAGKSEN
jgi:hypothetical protein